MKKLLSKKSSNDLILDGKYDEAIALLRKELKQSPDSHWDWTQLSSAYYEKRKYKLALRYAERAIGIMPHCPNALWHYAGAVSRFNIPEACEIYKRILKKGIAGLDGMKHCNEGHQANLGMLSDCRFYLACHYRLLGNDKESRRWSGLFLRHFNKNGIFKKIDFLEKVNGKVK